MLVMFVSVLSVVLATLLSRTTIQSEIGEMERDGLLSWGSEDRELSMLFLSRP